MNLLDVRAELDKLIKSIDLELATVPPVGTGTGTVPLGSNLASLMASAAPGAVINLPAGFVWSGTLDVLKPVSVRGPAIPTGRVSATILANAPKIIGQINIKVPDVSFKRLQQVGTRAEDILMTMNDRSIVDQCLILGSPLGAHRGIRTDGADCRVVNSHIANIWKDQDTQAIAGYDGTKNLIVDNCFLEASGENVMFGGVDPKSVLGIPRDIIIQNCHLFKPLSWVGKPGCTCKNLFELKDAIKVKFLNNLCQNSWVSGQVGFGIVLTPRNQDGLGPFCTVEDVLIEGNTIIHAQSGISILGTDNNHPSQIMKRIFFKNNKFLELGHQGNGTTMNLIDGAEDIVFEGNSFEGNVNTLMAFSGIPTKGLVVRGNRFQEGLYGIHSSANALGTATLTAMAPGYVWENNTIVKGSSGRVISYPTGTTLVTA